MKKRLLSFITCLALCLSLLPITAAASDTYTVSFDPNWTAGYEGQGTMESVEVPGGEYLLPESGYIPHPSYSFSDWSTSADGDDVLNGVYTVEEDTTLYAVWASYPVYVGGVGLNDGQSVDNSGKVITGKPASGGYAYYNNGVLELHNYSYTGAGYVHVYDDSESPVYSAAVYRTDDLEIKLTGENTLKSTTSDYYSNAIMVVSGNLTISGGGSLTITAGDDGIHADEGNVTISGGTVDITTGYDGIWAGDGVTISGGTVNITAGDDGIWTYYDVDISDGTVTVDAGYDGIVASSVTISGGTVTVDADYDGIYADDSVTISGESVQVFLQADDRAVYAPNSLGVTGMEILVPEDGSAGAYTDDSGTYHTILDSDNAAASVAVIVPEGDTHTWSGEYGYNATHHWKTCTEAGCFLHIDESLYAYVNGSGYAGHSETGPCECGYDTTKNAAVYVGGLGLAQGEYIDNNGKVSASKPASGGYAYYSNGVLELNNYVYSGAGYGYTYNDSTYYAAIYSEDALTVTLTGTNSLACTAYEGEGISGLADLTLKGSGTLTIQADGYGIYADGSVDISGGTVNITAGYYGIWAYSDVDISGGTVDITAADYDGICVDGGNVAISGGTVTVDAYLDGIYADGNVTISGGTVTVGSNYDGIYADGNVAISGFNTVVDVRCTGSDAYAISGSSVSVADSLKIVVPSGGVVSDATITEEDGTPAAVVSIHPNEDYVSSIYVGGMKLSDGEYIDNSGTVISGKPASGGYAYYASGKLELNNYVYSGGGYRYTDEYDGSTYYTAVYSENPLTVTLTGTNSLTCTGEDSDGITSLAALTIKGSGTVTITAGYDGIYTDGGDVTISGGTVDITTGDDGIEANSVDISGGTLTITAGDDGIWAYEGDVTISGGTVTITAGYDGIYADGGVTISGGTVNIDADKSGIDSPSVTIRGGTVTVTARNDEGIEAEDFVMSGGSVTITADSDGIDSAAGVTITGGQLSITADSNGIEAPEIRITGGTVEARSLNGDPNSAIGGNPLSPANSTIVLGIRMVILSPTDAAIRQQSEEDGEVVYTFDVIADSDGNIADYVKIKAKPYDHYIPTTTTTTTKNEDGSTTTTETNNVTGTVTETTKNTDGSTTVVETKRDGTVTITPIPTMGYVVGEITVTDRNGNEVEVIDNGDGTYTCIQPDGKVTVTVTYVEDACDGTAEDNCSSLAFSDLDTTKWYHKATDYVIENGLMKGVGGGKFDPNGTTSRAMIVTILWRLEGEPVVNYLMQFEDVPTDTWYTEAVRWAASEKIVEGYSDTAFGPNDAITREQFATILWRYAKYKGYDVSVGEDTNILSYEDAFSISEYAIPAMQWACGSGLMQGDGVNLTPKADAIRVQAAALFQRFCENVAAK